MTMIHSTSVCRCGAATVEIGMDSNGDFHSLTEGELVSENFLGDIQDTCSICPDCGRVVIHNRRWFSHWRETPNGMRQLWAAERRRLPPREPHFLW